MKKENIIIRLKWRPVMFSSNRRPKRSTLKSPYEVVGRKRRRSRSGSFKKSGRTVPDRLKSLTGFKPNWKG